MNDGHLLLRTVQNSISQFFLKNRATGLRAINIVFQEAELAKGLEHLRSGRCQATFLGWIKISGVVEFYSAWNE